MTIKLLADYPYSGNVTIPAGRVVSLLAASEAGLITDKLAVATAEAVNWFVPLDSSVPTEPGGALTFAELAATTDVVSGERTNRSVLSVGGDHPYAQWWGSNGVDGMAQMYLDLGIRPYLAICADESSDSTSGVGATLGKGNMMTAAQARELQTRGVEFVNHGARHTHFWDLFNTGIRVYYTGAEATPTVNISTTQLTTSTATTGATNFAFATYPTLATLAAAINALAGWNCLLATELLGTEPSATLVPLNAARSVVDAGGADPTDSNQRFAIAAGILVRYTGRDYMDVSVSVNSGSNFLVLYADGALRLATTTNTTLTAVVTAINALNITGLTALVMDNGYSAQSIGGSTALNPGQKIRETYCLGDEKATGLMRIDNNRSVNGFGLCITAGMGLAYTVRRAVLAAKERAASLYGLTLNSFAQSGGRMEQWLLGPILGEHVNWRANTTQPSDFVGGASPSPTPLNAGGRYVGHFTSITAASASTPFGEADVKAVIDALGDSDGWYVNWLNHLCTPTPGDPSPYTGMNQHSAGYYTSSADQDEGPFWRELQYAAAARDAGRIDIMPPTLAEKTRIMRRGPSNLIFNPKFRNGRGDNLLGITTTAQGSSGIACPGMIVVTSAGDYASAQVSAARELSLVTVGALGANKVPFAWTLQLEPGKTYNIGAQLDLTGWGAANKVQWVLYPINNLYGPPILLSQLAIASEGFYGGQIQDAQFRFSVPASRGGQPARIITKAAPFAFAAGDSFTLKIDNRTASAPIVLTGLTTSRQVADAINTAIAADATYGPLGKYRDVARVVDNRVVIEAPDVANVEDLALMEMLNSVGTPLAAMFAAGVTTARSTSKLGATVDARSFGYRLALGLSSTAAQQTLKILGPYCREVCL